MEENNTRLEQIERFLTGAMAAPERADFDRLMAEDETLRAAVSDYSTLIGGFNQMKEVAFQAQMQEWNQAWASSDEAEWIEAYVKGDLHPELENKISARLKTDTALATRVAEYKQLISGFSSMQDQAFANKLQEWDKSHAEDKKPATVRSLRPVFMRIAAAASVLLVLGIGFNWYAQNNYTGTILAESYYQEPSTGNTLGGENSKDQLMELFEDAHREYTQGQYDAAVRNFDNLLVTLADSDLEDSARKYFEENAFWTRALALIAQGEDLTRAKASLYVIANNPDNEYQKKAEELLKQLDSVFYRWAN